MPRKISRAAYADMFWTTTAENRELCGFSGDWMDKLDGKANAAGTEK